MAVECYSPIRRGPEDTDEALESGMQRCIANAMRCSYVFPWAEMQWHTPDVWVHPEISTPNFLAISERRLPPQDSDSGSD